MKNTLKTVKKIGIPVIILLIVILGGIYLLSQQSSQVSTTQNNTDSPYPQTSEAAGVKVIPVDNLKLVKLADTTVTFSDNYIVNTIIESKAVAGIVCGSKESENPSCIINFITDGTDTYHISTPFEPISNAGVKASRTKDEQLDTQNGSVTLKYDILEIVNENGDIVVEQSRVVQIYGCVKNGVCIGSGTLPFAALEDNQSAVTKFEEFVKSLTVK